MNQVVVVSCPHDPPVGAEVAAELGRQLVALGTRVLLVHLEGSGVDVSPLLATSEGPSLATTAPEAALEGPTAQDWRRQLHSLDLAGKGHLDVLRGLSAHVCERLRPQLEGDYDVVLMAVARADDAIARLLDVFVPVFIPHGPGLSSTCRMVEFIHDENAQRSRDRLRVAVLPVPALEPADPTAWLLPAVVALEPAYRTWLRAGAPLKDVLDQTVIGLPVAQHAALLRSVCEVAARLLAAHFVSAEEVLGLPTSGDWVRDLLSRELDRIESQYERSTSVVGFSSGLARLDEITGGFEPGQLVVVGGGPGHAKSDFCLKVAEEVAHLWRRAAAYLTPDTNEGAVTRRLLSQGCRVRTDKIRTALLVEPDWPKVSHGVGSLHDLPLYLDGRSMISLDMVVATSHQLHDISRDGPERLAAVLLDPISAIAAPPGESVARALKRLAMDLGVFILVACPTAPPPASVEDKRPSLGDLLGPPDLASTADIVVLLYRDELHDNESPDRGRIELHVAKHRGGATATLAAYYDPTTGVIGDLGEPTTA